jgi:hypothetical protein
VTTTQVDGDDERLPRGRFLVVGGDTAYPVADERTIRERFIEPMDYAHWARFREGQVPPPRPLLGVPGNHDWYDSIDGFNRLFRKSPTGAPGPVSARGLVSMQEASYFALGLPHGWGFWAMDARDAGDVDFRQGEFFKQLPVPAGLVVATPSPVVAFGRERPMLEKVAPFLGDDARAALRLWLSGDFHHYARYAPIGGDGPLRAVPSMVCGLGGASLHAPAPGEVRAEKTHPEVPEADAGVRARLLSPRHMLCGTRLYLVGAVLGALLGAAVSSFDSEASQELRAIPALDVAGALGRDAAGAAGGPWVLVGLTVASACAVGAYLYVKHHVVSENEATARQHSMVGRLAVTIAPLLLMLGGFVFYASLGTARSFGGVLLDMGFYVSSALLLLGLPAFLLTGFESGAALGRRVAVAVVGVATGVSYMGAVVFAVVLGARAVGSALPRWGVAMRTSHDPGVLAAFDAAGTLAAGLVGAGVLPLLLGAGFAVAFVLGSRRQESSSLAAIDQYQAFIRFRLRRLPDGRSSLTAFVIAVDAPVPMEALTRPGAPPGELVPKAFLLDVLTVASGRSSDTRSGQMTTPPSLETASRR